MRLLLPTHTHDGNEIGFGGVGRAEKHGWLLPLSIDDLTQVSDRTGQKNAYTGQKIGNLARNQFCMHAFLKSPGRPPASDRYEITAPTFSSL